PVYARCDVEAIVRMRQMLEKVTVEQGLALFLQTDGGIELSFGLTRHERTEEVDVSCGGFRVHQEVGACETEQCAQVVFTDQQSVNIDMAGWPAQQRNGKRQGGAVIDQTPHRIGTLVAEKQGI